MGTLAQDTFIRSNVSGGWGTATDGKSWAQVRGVQTLDVTSNEGHMVYNSSLTSGIMVLGSGTAATVENLGRFQVASLSDIAGLCLRFQDSNNWYSCVVGNTSQKLEFRKDVSGTFSTVGTATSFAYSTGTFYWMRFRIVSTTLSAKIWADGTGEPGSWTMTATDSSISAAGRYGVVSAPTSGPSTVTFDHFSVNDTAGAVTHLRIMDGYGGVFS